ncbi:MAG: hypothetical protein IPG89_08105 [Bacteroidetes bacterium]|nr:hypothetical protein [Bacteroidota bacterium]
MQAQEKFKLNFHQSMGLMLFSIGAYVLNPLNLSADYIFMLIGALVFMLSSNFGWMFFVSLAVLLIGYVFKMMHWPNGNLIIASGLLLAHISIYLKYIHKCKNLVLIILFIAMCILDLGFYLKISHVKFGSEVMLLGFALIVINYSFRFYSKEHKEFEDYNKLGLVIFWSLAGSFTLLHLPGAFVISCIFTIIFWLWLIFSLVRESKSNE